MPARETYRSMLDDAVKRVFTAAATIHNRRAALAELTIHRRERMPRDARRFHQQTPVSVVVDAQCADDDTIKLAISEDELYSRRALMLSNLVIVEQLEQTNRLLAEVAKGLSNQPILQQR